MKTLVRRGAIVDASLAILTGVAACGGGDDGGDATTTQATATVAALSAEQFRAQADAICTDYNGRLDALAAPGSAAEVSPYFAQAIAIYKEQLGKLQALTPPVELKPDYDAALGLLGQIVTLAETAKGRIDAGENAETVLTEVTPQLDAINSQADAKAKALGLTVCGSDTNGSTTSTTATAPVTTPSTTPSTTPTTAQPGQVVDTATFVSDVQSFAQILTQFGLTLQAAAEGPDALKARSALLRSQLDDFDAATARMASYTVDVPALDERRAAIVEASPDISRLGRELLDAAEKGDAAEVQRIVPEFQAALQRLSSAASGG